MEYMYSHSLKIPTKYHDIRLDIFNVVSIFSYAILPRLPLPYCEVKSLQFIWRSCTQKWDRSTDARSQMICSAVVPVPVKWA